MTSKNLCDTFYKNGFLIIYLFFFKPLLDKAEVYDIELIRIYGYVYAVKKGKYLL